LFVATLAEVPRGHLTTVKLEGALDASFEASGGVWAAVDVTVVALGGSIRPDPLG
jgi:hypothetical protein